MRNRVVVSTSLLVVLSLHLVGCAATPKQPKAPPTKVKERQMAVFQKPFGDVQQAAVNALIVIGCDIRMQEPTYVEGHRPQIWRALVPSGNETVRVWLQSLAPDQTQVTVKTLISFVGAGTQKKWDKEVLAEMTKSLAPGQ